VDPSDLLVVVTYIILAHNTHIEDNIRKCEWGKHVRTFLCVCM